MTALTDQHAAEYRTLEICATNVRIGDLIDHGTIPSAKPGTRVVLLEVLDIDATGHDIAFETTDRDEPIDIPIAIIRRPGDIVTIYRRI